MSPPLDPARNPDRLEQNAAVEETQARAPRSGALLLSRILLCRPPPTRAAPAPKSTAESSAALNGLAPTIQNYALGFTVTFPVSDLPRLRAREAAQSATIRAQHGALRSRSRPSCGRSGIAPSHAARRAPHRRQHARAGDRGAHRHAAGNGALPGGSRHHRRSRRSATPADPVGNRRRAGPPRCLARIARRRGRGRRLQPFFAEAGR